MSFFGVINPLHGGGVWGEWDGMCVCVGGGGSRSLRAILKGKNLPVRLPSVTDRSTGSSVGKALTCPSSSPAKGEVL